MKHSVTVQIAGVRYALKTDEDDRWVKAVAALVDERFREVQKKTRTPDTQAVAMLTALRTLMSEKGPLFCQHSMTLVAGMPRRLA